MTDFKNKLTTLAMGVSGSLDSVEPSSGVVPTGLTATGVSSALVTGVQTNTALGVNRVDAITGSSGLATGGGEGDDGPKAIRGK